MHESFARRCSHCVAGRACLRPTKSVPKYGDAPVEKTRSQIEDRTAESAYKRSLGNIPNQTPTDPWGNARSVDAPKAVAKPSAAKPRTKTSGTAGGDRRIYTPRALGCRWESRRSLDRRQHRKPLPGRRKFSASALPGRSSTASTRADDGPRRHDATMFDTTSSGPENSASTLPSGGCAPTPQGRAPLPGARPSTDSRRPAPCPGSSPDGSRRSSIV